MRKLSLALALLFAPMVASAQSWNLVRVNIPRDTTIRVDTTLVERVRVDTVRLVDSSVVVRTNLTGKGVRVAVLDNGVDQSNPTLRPAGGFDVTTNSGALTAWNEGVSVCNGHSTHIVGIVRQVAPEAEIFAVKVSRLGRSSCLTYDFDLAAGVDWAIANKARVIVISKWVPATTTISAAIQRAVSQGIVVVAAAGNNGTAGVTAPASFPGVIAVGSIGQSGAVSSFSSRGPQVYVVAPGEGIVSTVPVNTTAAMSGTSQAAPHVGGVIALLLQAVPTATSSQILTAICRGAIDIGPVGRDNDSGCGIVDAARSLNVLRNP